MKAKAKAIVKIGTTKTRSSTVSARAQDDSRVLFLACLIENVSEALISSDMEFKILGWNAAAGSLLGQRC